MSLSFVTKAIQTTTADGVFEEKPVAHADDGTAGRSSRSEGGGSGGLFAQLRQNQDEAEAERDEFQRSIMRGTLALDEDDAAHLDHLYRQKQAELTAKQQQTEAQIATFRAAQADRFERQNEVKFDGETGVPASNSMVDQALAPKESKPSFAPTIIKKRRRRLTQPGDNEIGKATEAVEADATITLKRKTVGPCHTIELAMDVHDAPTGGLSSLLAGYSSSSDEDTLYNR